MGGANPNAEWIFCFYVLCTWNHFVVQFTYGPLICAFELSMDIGQEGKFNNDIDVESLLHIPEDNDCVKKNLYMRQMKLTTEQTWVVSPIHILNQYFLSKINSCFNNQYIDVSLINSMLLISVKI